jgi:hypothetical protein
MSAHQAVGVGNISRCQRALFLADGGGVLLLSQLIGRKHRIEAVSLVRLLTRDSAHWLLSRQRSSEAKPAIEPMQVLFSVS